VTVLCLIEVDGDGAGGGVTAVLFADGDVPAAELLPIGELTAFGAADVYSVQAEQGYAPAAWARGLAELTVARDFPSAAGPPGPR
jgi:hypothetical protein